MSTKNCFKFSYNIALFVICTVLFIFFGMLNPIFFSKNYISETVKMIMEMGLMALPLTLLIVMAGIDFSMASTLAFAAIVGGIVSGVTNPVIGMFVTFVVGILCGAFNGFLIAILKLPPLVSTLATMYFFMGIAQGITLGNSAIGSNVPATPIAMFLGSGTVLKLPVQVWIFVIFAVILNLILSGTAFGRKLYAIGFNEDATRFSGINTRKTKFFTYMLSGFVFSIAGLVFMGRFSTIQYNSADSYTMQVITATVLGGADMNGGRGDIKGTVLGIIIIGILKGGMNVILLPQTQQKIIIGVILLVSLIVFEIINRHSLKVNPINEAESRGAT
jgi:ribose transport system permease protein/rhamnose transport system permease protein